MKIKHTLNNTKVIIIAAVLLAIAAGGVTAYAYMQSVNNTDDSSTKKEEDERRVNDIDYNPPTSEQIEAGNDKKTETIENETTSPQPVSTLTVSLTASQQNGSVVQIRTLLDSVVSGGTCQLELTKGSTTIKRTASIQALSSSSTCQGFDIPTSELSAGTWNITVSAISGSATGNTKGSVTVTP